MLTLLWAALITSWVQMASVSVQGTVVRVGSGEAVSKAIVELRREGGAAVPFAVTTIQEGRFEFRGIPSGTYRLSITRPGYVPYVHGQKRANGPIEPITIGAGQAAPSLRIALTPTGVVTGRIYDRQGRPLGNARVQAATASFLNGNQSMRAVDTTYTNDLGDYRLFGLAPGQYFVRAIPPIGSNHPITYGTQGSDPVYWFRYSPRSTQYVAAEIALLTYFPGTFDSLAASAIDLSPGAEVRGIDIFAAPITGWRISGVVVNSDTGQIAAPSRVLLSGPRTVMMPAVRDRFDFNGSLPGTYVLDATAGDLKGSATVEVTDRDVPNVKISVSPGFDVRGRILIEDPSGTGVRPALTSLRVNLRLDPPTRPGPSSPATPSADGTFVLKGASPGKYRVAVTPALENAYVKSIRLGDTDILNPGLLLEGQPSIPLEIVISTDPGMLEGTVVAVVNDRQEPQAGAAVALVPDTAFQRRTDLFRNATTDAAGRFRLPSLTPGDYTLYAWEDVEQGAWLNPIFMRRFENRGLRVRVTPGTSQTLSIPIIPAGQ